MTGPKRGDETSLNYDGTWVRAHGSDKPADRHRKLTAGKVWVDQARMCRTECKQWEANMSPFIHEQAQSSKNILAEMSARKSP
eukprot:scaffold154848_cov13-Tisochrysis_lutea.AAC.2